MKDIPKKCLQNCNMCSRIVVLKNQLIVLLAYLTMIQFDKRHNKPHTFPIPIHDINVWPHFYLVLVLMLMIYAIYFFMLWIISLRHLLFNLMNYKKQINRTTYPKTNRKMFLIRRPCQDSICNLESKISHKIEMQAATAFPMKSLS